MATGKMIGSQEKILIVDDEETIRELLHQTLAERGYQCEEAGNGDELLTKMRSNPAEMIIMDINMPGKPGDKLLMEIGTDYPDTAVIMATAITNVSTAIQCMKHGAYDYITKPFKLDDVTRSVQKALERRRLELENRDYQQNLEQKVNEQTRQIRGAFLNAITSLAYALEAKDKYTSGHSQRVSRMAMAVARELGIPANGIEKIRLAGLIHDIGKIGIGEAILAKPGVLTREEYHHIIAHCEIGERILSPIVDDEEILKMVRHHHERYDGKGYPDGLSADQIPLAANILAIADAFDAMTSTRSYRAALPLEQALGEIRQGTGTQFNPIVVDAFLKAHTARPILEEASNQTH